METKHTPGPWEARSIYGDKVAWEVYSAQWGQIVIVDDYPHKARRAEPDARLIAAAPALLEALKLIKELALRNWACFTKREIVYTMDRIMQTATKAIAQAEGGE